MARAPLQGLILLPALFIAGCSGVDTLPDSSPLTGVEIKRLFTDSSFTLIGMKSGNELVVYADAESCTMRYINGTRTKTVPWFTKGNMHCCIKRSKEVCGTIHEVDEGVYHKYQNGRHSHTMEDFSGDNRL